MLMPSNLFFDVYKKALHLLLGWYLLRLLLLPALDPFPVPKQNGRKPFLLSLAPSKGLRVAPKSWGQFNNILVSCI